MTNDILPVLTFIFYFIIVTILVGGHDPDDMINPEGE